VTNDDIQPKLVLKKQDDKNNGRDAVAGDFTTSVTGTGVSPSSSTGAESPGTNVALNAGSYSVGESGPSGYAASYSADCSGTVSDSGRETCRGREEDIQAKLLVNKHVVRNDGST